MGDGVTRRTSASFRINASGGARLSERVDAKILPTDLLEDDDLDGIELDVSVREDEDGGVFFDLFHPNMKNEATGRVFHTSMWVLLTHADIKRLRDFLDFLLASGLDGISDV